MLHHQPNGLRVLPVVVEVPEQFLVGQLPLPVNALLDRGKGIRRRGQRGEVYAHIVVLHAAVRDVPPALDGAVTEQIQRHLRHHILLMRHVEVNSLPGNLDGPPHVLLEKSPHLPDLFLNARIGHQFPQRRVEHLRHIDLDNVVERIFHAGKRAPMASGRHPIAREFERISVLHEPFGETLFAHKSGTAHLVVEQIFHGLVEQLRIQTVPDPDGDVGGDLQAMSGLEHKKRDRVGPVRAARIRTADLVVLRVDEQHTDQMKDGLLVV